MEKFVVLVLFIDVEHLDDSGIHHGTVEFKAPTAKACNTFEEAEKERDELIQRDIELYREDYGEDFEYSLLGEDKHLGDERQLMIGSPCDRMIFYKIQPVVVG